MYWVLGVVVVLTALVVLAWRRGPSYDVVAPIRIDDQPSHNLGTRMHDRFSGGHV